MRLARTLVRSLVVAVFATATLLAVAELALRGLYAYAFRSTERSPILYERVYWAVPPWVAYTSILYDDPELGNWMRPNATRTYIDLFGPIGDLADVGAMFRSLFPTLPAWARARPVWHLTTNSLGLRGPELAKARPADTFRIAVLGDSWTVGINVEAEQTYPSQLAELLGRAAAPHRVEVLDFGVIGGRAETGRRLLPRVLAYRPDLVIVAYAQNDEADVRDAPRHPPRPAGAQPVARLRWRALLRASELYELYRWWNTPGGDRIVATLQHELTRPTAVPMNDPGRFCPHDQVATTPYHAAMDEIVRTLGDRAVPAILVYNNVPDFLSHCTLRSLAHLSRTYGVPLVDSSAVLEGLERQSASDLAARLGLATDAGRRSARPHTIDAVLRVDMSTARDAKQPYVMGNALALGAFVPNLVPLHDDGSHGDERAGDGVWSMTVSLAAPGVLTYLFTDGQRGTWTGLENYRLRAFALRRGDAGHTVLLPVAQFGRQALRSDSSHPDAAGHRAIAEAIADVVRRDARFAAFAAGPPVSPPSP